MFFLSPNFIEIKIIDLKDLKEYIIWPGTHKREIYVIFKTNYVCILISDNLTVVETIFFDRSKYITISKYL